HLQLQDKNRLHTRPTAYYNHFFAHPYAKDTRRYRSNIRTSGFEKVISDMNEIIKVSEELEKDVLKNKINIRNLAFVAKHIKFYCKKRFNSKSMVGFNPKYEKHRIQRINEIDNLKRDLGSLLLEYEHLWIKCARKEGFNSIKTYYLWLIKFYGDKIEQLKNNVKWEDPNIPSELIYLDTKELHNTYTTFYQKVINIDGQIEQAYLQVIGGTYAKVSINEIYIGYTITRHSLNYITLENNIQIFDIKSSLKQGKNTITIENVDFIGGLCPINVYGEIKLVNTKSIIILTDKSWLATRTFNNDWREVKSFGKPPKATGGLSYPNFEDSMHSKENDALASLNSLACRKSKKFFWILKLIFRLFHRYDVLE
ncbi:MAG: hypothetical protein ACFFDN_24220, partial [Candidatus Hodarchaeota archaeon]